MKKLQTNQSGFTIIEVLIVLAIAGLIMLIVFLAVPALQRNSRNTQRKNDAQKLLAATNEWATANNWAISPDYGITSFNQIIANAGGMSQYKSGLNGLGQGDIAAAVGATTANSNTDLITLVLNGKCASSSSTAAQARSAAVMFYIEAGSNLVPQCLGA
ncbi:prepilin-type N-terminal cleavage/methylation domain-containing protein [Candidatus Saccharibacteria bacterium]|nr:prepilin-type N-terminal cleavage/methylation domain-containing protein [Candidatus Saccharibacteria bacterium]